KNTIIIMTSNLGSQLISERISADFQGNGDWEQVFGDLKQDLHQLLRKTIRPEFLNRIDEIIVFRPLNRDDIRQVVDLQLARLEELLQKKDISIHVNDDAKDWLAKLGYDPMFGARPLKRVIQKHIVNPFSQKILQGEFNEGDSVEVGLDQRGLIEFTKKLDVAVER
ncbi:MAG: AAA family ATPase, partial [Bacteroidetes bacterium]|nr:AAA family ATPase [Bacteroidota bacterium]